MDNADMDIGVRTTRIGPDPNEPPSHALPGGRPETPIAASIYTASITYGKESRAVIEALYEAVKLLEAEIAQLRDASGK